jgi:hypothetical protein
LSEPHKRGINTTLTLLDEALNELEQWGHGREIRSVLYMETNTLSPEQRKAILSEVKNMRERLLELRNTLHLEGSTRDAVRTIRGQCSSVWVNLSELQGRHLSRYGEPPLGLAEYLEPRIEELIGHMRYISRLVEGVLMTDQPS